MHVQMRRVPAERVRHAKRLGPVVLSTTTTTTTSSQTSTSQTTSTTPSASSTQPSSSALPTTSSTPSATPSATPVSSSATSSTSSTHSSATSTPSTQLSPTTEPPSSMTTTQPAVLTSPYPSSSSALTPTPQTHASASSSGLSGGAIAGIIAGAVIVGVALIVFLVRKTYLRRRERKLISWDEVPETGNFDEPKFPDIGERSGTPPPRGSPFETRGQSMYPTPVAPAVRMQPTTPSYAVPSPPPATYNNPTPVSAYPTPRVPSTYGNTAAFAGGRVASGMAPAQHAQAEAIVKCTFVPTLPDELSITTGERIFVVEQYDDGWDLCANGRGERGMVPRECLERAPSDQPDVSWMNAGRMSSLNDGQRY